MEATIDNILEGRLLNPPSHMFPNEDEFDEVAGPSTSGSEGGSGSPFASDYSLASTSSSDSGYEIERNSNIFGNQNELLRDER